MSKIAQLQIAFLGLMTIVLLVVAYQKSQNPPPRVHPAAIQRSR